MKQAVAGVRARVDRRRVSRRMQQQMAAWSDRWPAVPPIPRVGEPTTTVVLPCYNHEDHLPVAVQSLVAQTLASFETVLVDDFSTDGTSSLLDGLAAALRLKGRVTVVRHDRNVGQAATLNGAIASTATSWVTVLNDDDWLVPTALQCLLAVVREQPDLALVGAGSQWFTGSGAPQLTTAVAAAGAVVRRFEPSEVRQFRYPNDLNMTHSGTTVSRAAWETVGGYRSDIRQRVVPFSDRDLQLRVAALYPVAVVRAPLVWWRSDSSVDAGVNS